MVVLGGSVGMAGPEMIGYVEAALQKHALSSDSVRVVQSTLGDQAALIGSVLMAMHVSVPSYRLVAASTEPVPVAAV
jgi:hypothetical protein